MSAEATGWAWALPDLTSTSAITLLALADVADARGVARVDADWLSARARLPRQTLAGVLSVLQDAGLATAMVGDFPAIEVWLHMTVQPVPVTVREPAPAASLDLELPIVASTEAFGFDEFWALYPRRTGRAAARRAWDKAIRSTPEAVVLEGAKRFAEDPNLPEKSFIPHPATWLNGGRWSDEPLPARQRSNFEQNLDDLQRRPDRGEELGDGR